MIVECVGLPGSGKSSFLRELFLEAEPRFKRVAIPNKGERICWFFLAGLRHPCIVARFIQASFQQSKILRRYVFALCASSLAETQKAAHLSWRHPKNVYFLDEGLLQRAFSCFSASEFEGVYALLRSMDHERVYLFFKGGRFDRFEKDEDAKQSPRIQAGDEVYKQWKTALIQSCAWLEKVTINDPRVVVLDNTHRPDRRTLIALVKECLQNLNAFSS